MKSRLRPIAAAILLSLCSDVFSFTDSAYLAQMLAQMQEEYKKVVEQLDNVKAINENMDQVKNGIRAIQREYEFVNSFSLESQLNQIKADIDSLTSLDDINDVKDTMQRINIVLREMDRRIAPENNKKASDHLSTISKSSSALEAAIAAYAEEARSAGSDYKTAGDQLSGINSATSMLAAQALVERREKLETEIKRTEEAMQHVANDSSILNYFGGAK